MMSRGARNHGSAWADRHARTRKGDRQTCCVPSFLHRIAAPCFCSACLHTISTHNVYTVRLHGGLSSFCHHLDTIFPAGQERVVATSHAKRTPTTTGHHFSEHEVNASPVVRKPKPTQARLLSVDDLLRIQLSKVASEFPSLPQPFQGSCVPKSNNKQPVSYTHLTLPTICSV